MMLKTFFEKIPLKDGDVFVNYTSAIKDATLERLWCYSVRRFKDDTMVCEAEDFTCLSQARHAVWEVFADMVTPLTPIACHETDDEATKEILDRDELFDYQHPPIKDTLFGDYLFDKDAPYLPHDERPFP